MKRTFFATCFVTATAILASCGSDNGSTFGMPQGNTGGTGVVGGHAGTYVGAGGYTSSYGGGPAAGGATGIAGYGASILPPGGGAGAYILPPGFTQATSGGWKLGDPYDGKGPIGGVGGAGGAGGNAGAIGAGGVAGTTGAGGVAGTTGAGGASLADGAVVDGAVDGAVADGDVDGAAGGGTDGAATDGNVDASVVPDTGRVNEFAEAEAPDVSVPDCGTTVKGVVRDFRRGDQPGGHPDFEKFQSNTGIQGVLEQTLGADMKPVFVAGQHPLFTTKANFDQWYRNVDGVNKAYLIEFSLAPNGASFRFFSDAFFPLDGTGWGNEGFAHNYHFTTEVHTQFYYVGGEVFSFRGDDDLWVFVNNKLGIDLGGLHPPLTATINMDAMAAQLGIEKGKVYALDLFHAERHTVLSNFEINTNLHFVNCGIIVPDIR